MMKQRRFNINIHVNLLPTLLHTRGRVYNFPTFRPLTREQVSHTLYNYQSQPARRFNCCHRRVKNMASQEKKEMIKM